MKGTEAWVRPTAELEGMQSTTLKGEERFPDCISAGGSQLGRDNQTTADKDTAQERDGVSVRPVRHAGRHGILWQVTETSRLK